MMFLGGFGLSGTGKLTAIRGITKSEDYQNSGMRSTTISTKL